MRTVPLDSSDPYSVGFSDGRRMTQNAIADMLEAVDWGPTLRGALRELARRIREGEALPRTPPSP